MRSLAVAILAVLTVSFLWSGGASAQTNYDNPVYHQETGNYYELVKVRAGHSARGPGVPAVTWAKAAQLAAERTHKGIRGRLAVVKSGAVNDFLRRTFRADEKAWIGLRYWCQFNRLQWLSGEFLKPGQFTNWDPQWFHDGGTHGGTRRPACGRNKNQYWPVHYWPVKNGFRWNANGSGKEARSYFVEYPADRL